MFVPVSEPNFKMAHHEDSHNDHGHDTTEGNRQYYPQGWYMPLLGLFAVALIFAIGAGALLGISGSDKWGKHETCHTQNCDGHCGMEHEKACCSDGTCEKCQGEHGDQHGGTQGHTDLPVTGHDNVFDSTGNATGGDTLHPGNDHQSGSTTEGHEGHGH
jgi:hypothetical protein